MATLRARTSVAPLDVDRWIAAAASVLCHARALTFVDGSVVHPETGAVHEGLRDLTGTHPREGTRYSLVTVADDGVREEVTIELIEDGRRRWRARLFNEHGAIDVSVADPSRPDRADVAASAASTTVDGTIDVATDPDGVPRRPLAVDVRHRRVRASVETRVSADWEVVVAVRVRGRGVFRPVVAVAAVFASRRAERELQFQLEQIVDEIETRNAELANTSPDSMGRQLVCQLVDHAVVSDGEQLS